MNRKTIPAEEIQKASPEELIRAFSPWLRFVVKKYQSFLLRSGVLDYEDLYWAGALALVDSQKTWNPAEGSFLTYSFYSVRQAIQRQLSFGKKEIEPPLVYLDAPLLNNEDLTLMDTIASTPSDEKGPEEIAEDHDLHEHIQAALDRNCDSFGQTVMKKRFYEELTINEAAAALEVEPRIIQNYQSRCLNRLRKDHMLKNMAFLDYYRRVGLSEYKVTLTSEVELAAIRKEKMFNRSNGPSAYMTENQRLGNHEK